MKKRKDFIKENLIIYFITLFLTALLFGNNILQYQGKKAAILIAVIAIIIDTLFFVLSCKIKELYKQAALGLFPFFLFIMSSVIFNSDRINYESTFSRGLIIFFTIYMFIIISIFVGFIRNYNKKNMSLWLRDNSAMLIVLIIICISRIPFMNLLQRWDAGEYYYRMGLALENFSYSSIREFINTFSLCGHSASLFCMLYMAGEMVWPGHIIGVSVINLVLTLIAMWCIYKIIIKITENTSRSICAVYTLLISFVPIVYTFTMHLNLDYAMALFVVMIIYSYLYEKSLLAGLLSIICFQTKENGIVIVAGIALGEIVRHILDDKGKRIKSIFTDSKLYMTLAAALVQLMYYIVFGNNWSGPGTDGDAAGMFTWNSNGSECFGFNTDYIWMKFRQQFILNFNWIVSLIIILGTIYIIANRKYLRKKRGVSADGNYLVCTIAGALITHSMFAYLYITGTCTRYNIISDILMYIIAIYVINKIKEIYRYKHKQEEKNKGCKTAWIIDKCILGIWIIILVTECFITIDSVSMRLFTKADSITRDTLIMTNEHKLMVYGESLIHNTQFQCYDKSIDKMLKAVDYDPDTTDIYLYDDGGVFICGNVPLYYLNWDREKKKRVFYNNENTVQMADYHLISKLKKRGYQEIEDSGTKGKAIFVVATYYVNKKVDIDYSLDVLSRYYDISERKTSSTYQGGIYYYELTLR